MVLWWELGLPIEPLNPMGKVAMTKSTGEYGIFYGDNLYDYAAMKEPLIDCLLYRNDTICISSKPGTGKSILVLQWIFNLTTATAFLETYKVEKPCNVLYIQTEGDRAETIERISNMKKGLQIDDERLVHINLPGIMLNKDVGIRSLIEMAKEPGITYDVIIIDPLYTTVKGSMINDEVATDWVRNARILKAEFEAAMIVNHHDTKDSYHEGKVVRKSDNDIFGSTFWSAFFNHNFKFKAINGVHYLIVGKQRSGKIMDKIPMKMVEPAPLLFTSNEDMSLGHIKVKKVLEGSDKRFTYKQLVAMTQLSKNTIYRAIHSLGKAVENVAEGGTSYYRWKG